MLEEIRDHLRGATPLERVEMVLFDERGLSAFHIKLLVWSLFIVLIDGYDIGAIAFAAPSLVRSWGVDREALDALLAANLDRNPRVVRQGRRSGPPIASDRATACATACRAAA